MSGSLSFVDSIIVGDNVAVLRTFPDNCIDLTVTSPPYDNLRKYKGFTWDFEGLAQELYRVTKPGGVVVWVVADEVIKTGPRKGSETGNSMRQALHFMNTGFLLYDTMIYEKENPLPRQSKRYEQAWEFMFVLTKDLPAVARLRLVPCKRAGQTGVSTVRDCGRDERRRTRDTIRETKIERNVWAYGVGGKGLASDPIVHAHPAIFPEKLAEDHILSWSNPGDVVLDPFNGSGTTCKMAMMTGRRFVGIDASDEYCEIARKRLAAVRQQALFD